MMDLRTFISETVKPATGCTEPAAVAYAVAVAYHSLYDSFPPNFKKDLPSFDESKLGLIEVTTDRNVFKNAHAIVIPGTYGKSGLEIATAMGVFCDPSKSIDVFEGADDDLVDHAQRLIDLKKIKVDKIKDRACEAKLDITVLMSYGSHSSKVRLQGGHTNITEIEKDKEIKYKHDLEETTANNGFSGSIIKFMALCEGMDSSIRQEIRAGIDMNMAAAEEGMKRIYGLGVYNRLESLASKGVISRDLSFLARSYTAAACDARMGGAKVRVMTTSGSGNQGILAVLPIALIGKKLGRNEQIIEEGVLLSHLVTKYASSYSGHLSALCGCSIKAGLGATAGLTYALGGAHKQIENAINLVSANITGILCDGAKAGCALKLSTAAGTVVESAFMALEGMDVPLDNGIIGATAEDTIRNIGKISRAMVRTDIAVVDIMQSKK